MRSEIIKSIDDIAQHIVESQDKQAALEFTKVIGKLLKENGVSVYGTEYEDDALRQIRHGYKIEMLDFFQHDKEVNNELFDKVSFRNAIIDELRLRIENLRLDLDKARETNGVVLPAEPLDVVKILVTETMHYTNKFTGLETECRKYGIKDLEQIAEHLRIYCEWNKEDENGNVILSDDKTEVLTEGIKINC